MKYQKKPVVVEAVQYNPEGYDLSLLADDNYSYKDFFSEIPNWMQQAIDDETVFIVLSENYHASIETMEGDMTIKDGAYIIQGVQGEIYACDEDIFHETYEEVNK